MLKKDQSLEMLNFYPGVNRSLKRDEMKESLQKMNSNSGLAVERLVTSHRPEATGTTSSSQLVRVEEEATEELMPSSVVGSNEQGTYGEDQTRVAGDTYKLMQPNAQASLGRHMRWLFFRVS